MELQPLLTKTRLSQNMGGYEAHVFIFSSVTLRACWKTLAGEKLKTRRGVQKDKYINFYWNHKKRKTQ